MQSKLTFSAKAPATAMPGETVTLTLTAKNDGKATEVLRYRNGGRVDMQLVNSGGKVVFHWSKGMMFTMALAAEKLDPSQSKSWTITGQLPADLPLGGYTLRIWSMATGLETSSTVNVNVRVIR